MIPHATLHRLVCGTREQNLATAQAEAARRAQAMARRIAALDGAERAALERKAADDAALWREIVAWAVDCGPGDLAPLVATARTTADHYLAAMAARPWTTPPQDAAADARAASLHQLARALEADHAWRMGTPAAERKAA